MTQTTTERLNLTPLDAGFAEDFCARWAGAWNAHDAEGVARLCTGDVEFSDPGLGTVRGRAAVAAWVTASVRAFPDLRFEATEAPYLAREAPRVIQPWRMRGTHAGPLDPPGYAPTGRAFVVDGVDRYAFRDGLVAWYRADYDTAGVSRQLGLLPGRGTRLERIAARLQRLAARRRGHSRKEGSS